MAYCQPRSDRGADGELKLASFCSSRVSYSAPGRLGFVYLHGLSAVYNVPPSKQPNKLLRRYIHSAQIALVIQRHTQIKK